MRTKKRKTEETNKGEKRKRNNQSDSEMEASGSDDGGVKQDYLAESSVVRKWLAGRKRKLQPVPIESQIENTTVCIPFPDKMSIKTFAGSLLTNTLTNPFAHALTEMFGASSLIPQTCFSMIGYTFSDPFSIETEPAEEKILADLEKETTYKYTLLLHMSPPEVDVSGKEQIYNIMRLKAMIAALAVGKSFVPESIDNGLANRMSAMLSTLRKTYTKTIEIPFPYHKYTEYKTWVMQFPSLICRIVHYSRYGLPGISDSHRAIYTQADLLNMNSGMTQILITHTFIMSAEVKALTMKLFEDEVERFLDEFDRLKSKYKDNFSYIGICDPQQLAGLHRSKFEKLYAVSHQWFVSGSSGSRSKLRFETSTTITDDQMRIYLKTVDIRSGEGGSIKPELAKRMGVSQPSDKNKALEEILRTIQDSR